MKQINLENIIHIAPILSVSSVLTLLNEVIEHLLQFLDPLFLAPLELIARIRSILITTLTFVVTRGDAQ